MLEGIRQKERPGLEGREARLRVGGRRLRGDRERTTQTDKRAGQVPAGNTWRESGTRCSSGCGRRMEEPYELLRSSYVHVPVSVAVRGASSVSPVPWMNTQGFKTALAEATRASSS